MISISKKLDTMINTQSLTVIKKKALVQKPTSLMQMQSKMKTKRILHQSKDVQAPNLSKYMKVNNIFNSQKKKHDSPVQKQITGSSKN